MKFGGNLQKLRKGINMSQEQLAEQLGVSRQSVSKWESNQTYPEMDKLLIMSKMFSCSLDDLVQGNIKVQNKENNNDYDIFYKKFAGAIASGVSIILFGLTIFLFMHNYLDEDSVLPIVVFMISVLIAVIIFICYGLGMERYDRIEKPNYTMDEYYENFSRKFNFGVASGVGLCIFALIVFLFTTSIFGDDSTLPVTMFMAFITIAVYIFVYCGIMRNKYEVGSKESSIDSVEEKVSEVISKDVKQEKVSSVIMLLATIIYLYLGFIENMWHPGWLVFVFAGLLCAISEIILD